MSGIPEQKRMKPWFMKWKAGWEDLQKKEDQLSAYFKILMAEFVTPRVSGQMEQDPDLIRFKKEYGEAKSALLRALESEASMEASEGAAENTQGLLGQLSVPVQVSAAEERKLGEEKQGLESEAHEAEARPLEAAQKPQKREAKAALLEMEQREAKAKEREAWVHQNWQSGLDPKTDRVFYRHTVTNAQVWTAPEGYVLEGIALERKQEADRQAAYTLERERKAGAEKAQAAQGAEELSEFLRCIAYGEQEKAEKMLQQRPILALHKGDLCDPSGREFKEITGFQYAVWGLDWHMWQMLLRYMDKEAAAMQWAELEKKGTAHGRHFSLAPLLKTLNRYVLQYEDRHHRSAWGEMEEHWCKGVGGSQRLLPVSVVNEYCHPNRSFVPLPSFKEEGAWVRSTKLCGGQGRWYTAVYQEGRLGEKFAICRYNMAAAAIGDLSFLKLISKTYVKGDADAIQRLWLIRQQQLAELRTLLRPRVQAGLK